MKISSILLPEEIFILSVFFEKECWKINYIPRDLKCNARLLYSLLKKQKLLRSFAYEVLTNQKLKNSFLTEEIYNDLRQVLKISEIEQQIYVEILSEVENVLSSAGIKNCLMKGISLDIDNIPRDTNDLDLLVNEKDIERTDEIMLKAGFIFQGDKRKLKLRNEDLNGNISSLKQWTNQFEYKKIHSDLLVEIHTHLFELKRIFRFEMDKIWKYSDKLLEDSIYDNNLKCKKLRPTDNLWLMCLHNAFRRSVVNHQLALRYIIDMKNLILRNTIDWERLQQHAYSTETQGFTLFSLEMIEYFFPKTIQTDVIDTLYNNLKRKEQFFRKIQHGCLHSLYESSRLYTELYRFFLPFIYNGTVQNKLQSIFQSFRIFKIPVKRAFRQFSMRRIRIG